ncbi:hypothetical protein GR160_17425 [Flavobacterium sp. Sd200]|uniref:PepSY-associated TM helix domain-containing protein n=1 Tax=Flavobacterium sp. Sd200 TaxID=2692211 RepID=UPI00136B355D|nr:PepSY-associated TM helix domain-containing protein [Flavobacterium sp. Sd200]MXN93010.1 hypothetical protein [Flavobacterium sp. Sd200]
MAFDRKKIFEIHSWIGTKLSILFFIVCFSGTFATLSTEMDWLFNPETRATPQAAIVSRSLIAKNFKQKYPDGTIIHWSKNNAPYVCDILTKEENGKKTYVFANQYTGAIQGETNLTIQRYFRKLHYNLFMPMQIGHFTVLFFGFLLFVSLTTALLFYKKWWHKLFELTTGKGPIVFFRSLHRLVGLWSVPFTLLFSLTGFWYFLERTNIAGLGDAGNPELPVIADEKGKEQQIEASKTVDFDKAVSIAQNTIDGLKVGDISMPGNETDYMYLTGKSDEPLVRQRANRVFIDTKNYKVVARQDAQNIGTVIYIADIADPLHFGNWGGLTTKIIWFVAGLGICSLILSGIYITLKKRALKKKGKRAPIMGVWKYINLAVNAVLLYFMYASLIKSATTTGVVIYITLVWLALIATAYYVFVYRINKLAALEKSK